MSNESMGGWVAPHPIHEVEATTNPSRGGVGRFPALPTIWRIDAFLWLMFLVNLALILTESLFGVFSGLTLLLGDVTALLLALALIFCGAAMLIQVRIPKAQTAQATPVFASDTVTPEQWKVRTAPRKTSPRARSAASRGVMEATL